MVVQCRLINASPDIRGRSRVSENQSSGSVIEYQVAGEPQMALSDITDSTAVLQAAHEFDALGRDAFLARYGVGKARGYFLVLSGKRYDSKAIMGAAHGYQFPERGPLRAADISGGDATVKTKLEQLGFTVESASADTSQVSRPKYTSSCLCLG